MASEQTPFVLSSSSGSSEGVQSENGTPDTKDTVFSPEKTRFNSKGKAPVRAPVQSRLTIHRSNYALPKFLEDSTSCHGSDWDVDETDQLVSGGLSDPFMGSANPKRRHGSIDHRLSPTASCFTPATGKETPKSSNSGSSVGANVALTRSESHGVTEESAPTTDSNGEVKRHLTCVANGSTPYPTSLQVGPSSSSREGGRVLAVTANPSSEHPRDAPIIRSLVIQGNALQGGPLILNGAFKTFMTVSLSSLKPERSIFVLEVWQGKMADIRVL